MSPFLDEMDEYDTVLKGCMAKGYDKVVIAIGEHDRDHDRAQAYVARHDIGGMDVTIQVLPDLESGEVWNGRRVIKYRWF